MENIWRGKEKRVEGMVESRKEKTVYVLMQPPLSSDSLGWQRNPGEHQRGELRGWGRMGTDKGLQIRTAVSTVNYEPDQRKL